MHASLCVSTVKKYFCYIFVHIYKRRTLDWFKILKPFRRHWQFRSSPSEMFLGKYVLKICSKFTGEHPRRSAISIKLLCNFIENTLRHGCSPVNLLHIFRRPVPKNTCGGLILTVKGWGGFFLCKAPDILKKKILFSDECSFSFHQAYIIGKCIQSGIIYFKVSESRYRQCGVTPHF